MRRQIIATSALAYGFADFRLLLSLGDDCIWPGMPQRWPH